LSYGLKKNESAKIRLEFSLASFAAAGQSNRSLDDRLVPKAFGVLLLPSPHLRKKGNRFAFKPIVDGPANVLISNTKTALRENVREGARRHRQPSLSTSPGWALSRAAGTRRPPPSQVVENDKQMFKPLRAGEGQHGVDG
jgi:hypothetical protein